MFIKLYLVRNKRISIQSNYRITKNSLLARGRPVDGMSYASSLVEGPENDPEQSAVMFLTQLAGAVS